MRECGGHARVHVEEPYDVYRPWDLVANEVIVVLTDEPVAIGVSVIGPITIGGLTVELGMITSWDLWECHPLTEETSVHGSD